jgi:hypothetical protein
MATFIEVHEYDNGESGLVHWVNVDHIVKFRNVSIDDRDGSVILLSVDRRMTAMDFADFDRTGDSPNTMWVFESSQLIMDRIRNARNT